MMEPLKTLKKAIDEIGGKKSNYREEIYEKRVCQRRLTQEFGMNVFYAYQKGKRDQVDPLYEELAMRYDELNKEIHRLESRYLATQKYPIGETTFKTVLLSDEKTVFDRSASCAKCQEHIADEKLVMCRLDEAEAEKLYFHNACFSCQICSKNFLGTELSTCSFLAGKPCCEGCFSQAENHLLSWCQTSLADFQRVEIRDFDTSFNNGVAFAALIRHWKPEYIDMTGVNLDNPVATLTTAFQGMEWAGIPVILHPQFLHEMDRFSIVTQVGLIKQKFENLTPHPEGKNYWNKFLLPKRQYQCKGDEFLKGKDHVISSNEELKNESKSSQKEEPTMIFDNDPTLVTGGGSHSSSGGRAYEIWDKTTGERTVREPVSGRTDS